MHMKLKWKPLALGGIIAALYVALVWAILPLASGAVQIRFAEALAVMPVFTPAGIPGVAIGCFLANLLTGAVPMDVIFGTLATLIGAVGTRLLRGHRFLSLLPPILANVIILPFVFRYAYGMEGSLWYFALTVGIGEIISVGILGSLLRLALEPRKNLFE